MKHKKILLIGIILIIIILFISIKLINKKDTNKQYDTKKMSIFFKENYKELFLNDMDKYDISSYFGIEELDNSLYLKNLKIDSEGNIEKTEETFIIFINTTDSSYYDALYSYIESSKLNIEDKDILKLFKTSILKKGNNYVYFIFNKNSKTLEKELLNLMK